MSCRSRGGIPWCRVAALAALTLAAARAADAQTPAELVRRAADAAGGSAAVRGLANAVVDYNAVTFQLGQEETPGSPARATVAFGQYHADFRGNRYALAQETRPFAGQPTRQRRIMANGIGLVANNANVNPDSPVGVAGVERTMRTSPLRILAAALETPSALAPVRARRWRGEVMDGVRLTSRDTATLFFDRGSGHLTVVETVADDPILGDRRTATIYTRWQDAGGGLKLPRQIDTEVNGRLSQHQVVTAAAVNASLADSVFAIPDSIATRAARGPAAPPAVTVTLNELAPGVWRAEGGSHFSLVVEQPDRLVVVEAPLNSARSAAVLDTLRSRFPRKRVGLVVNTHHHWDHAGGLRGYLAAGVPVATHRRNVEFVRGIGTAAKTVAPDALSRGRAVPAVTAVGDSLALGSGDSRLVIYRLPSVHGEGILAAYHPAARLLFVADVLSPSANLPAAGSREVAALVAARGIAVERVAGAHGGVAPWGDVTRAAGN